MAKNTEYAEYNKTECPLLKSLGCAQRKIHSLNYIYIYIYIYIYMYIDSDAGRDWGQEEKGTTEDEMAAWHHWLDGRESKWTLGVGDGQGGMAYCDSWGHKESDTTEWLNWTELIYIYIYIYI